MRESRKGPCSVLNQARLKSVAPAVHELQLSAEKGAVDRKGLSGTARKRSRINDLAPPQLARLYQGNVLLSSDPDS